MIMPKAMLLFKLPEEQEEFNNAIKAPDVISALCELQGELRNYLKHGIGEPEKLLEKTYSEICKIIYQEEG
jgi:hypothetical protein